MVEVLAFSESEQAELMRLGDGDAVSVQGAGARMPEQAQSSA
jgi:hypothetical protein